MDMNSKQLDRIAQFEQRMEAVAKDDPDRAQACRQVHNMLTNAKHVAESVFNDDVADNPEVCLSIAAAIADELEDIKNEREEGEENGDAGER